MFVFLHILNPNHSFYLPVVCAYSFHRKKMLFLKMNYFYKNHMRFQGNVHVKDFSLLKNNNGCDAIFIYN